MTISDPAGILQRVPELQDLTGDNKIRHAIESGDPFRVYRSLMLARLFRRLPQHKALLQMLTSQRRLFARPLKGTPSLGTINSVGFSFVGREDCDVEGYHVALHAFVVLFALPLIPLGSYLVQSTGENQWRIFARVPLGIWGWLYTRGVAGALVLLVLFGAGTSVHQASTQDLIILNGFPEPLDIAMDGQTTVVPAQGKTTVTLKAGPQHLVASMARVGQVDALNETIRSNSNTLIWNVAGAAPLVQSDVVYYAQFNKPATLPPMKHEVYCGKRVIELGAVDYLFNDPPASMKMNKYETTHTVKHVGLIRQDKLSGVETCVNWAFDQGQSKSIAHALRTLAAMRDWQVAETWIAAMAAWQVSPAEARNVLVAARRAHPQQIDLERGYRDLMQTMGQEEALRKEYEERITRQPQDPVALYLLASISHGRAGLTEMESVRHRFPAFVPVMASLVWRKVAHHDYAGAERDFQRLRTLSPEEAAESIEIGSDALLGQHRRAEARLMLQAALSDKKRDDRYPLATQIAVLDRLAGSKSDDVLTEANFADAQWLDLARTQVGLPLLHLQNARSGEIDMVQALRDSPAKAIELVEKNAPFSSLSSEYQTFLYALAMHRKNRSVLDKMQFYQRYAKADQQLLQAYIDGADVDLEQGDFVPDMQLAAIFFRSRNRQLPASERSQLRKLAFASDLRPNLVRHALNNWPE